MQHMIKSIIDGTIAEYLGNSSKSHSYKIERPKNKKHGHFSTNIAFILSKELRRNPRDIAQEFIKHIKDTKVISKLEIAGPGFINIFIKDEFIQKTIWGILTCGVKPYSANNTKNRNILVEFVSANPTGPLHIGHGRGAIFGDALSSILSSAGYNVTNEYYVNDAGNQIDVIVKSVMIRYLELHNIKIDIPKDFYPGEYVIDIAKEIKSIYGNKWTDYKISENPPKDVRSFTLNYLVKVIKKDLDSININFNTWFHESSLHSSNAIEETIDDLSDKNLTYLGKLPTPKGYKEEDNNDEEQLLFRSSNFGDASDRTLKKSDSSYTYFAADVAYHKSKLDREYTDLINIWGADHKGYIKRVEASIEALTGESDVLDVKTVQMVKILRDGAPVKASKRNGNIIPLKEIVDEVGSDALRFWFLSKDNDTQIDFDLNEVVKKNKDNPVYYVQYAHARICSIWNKAINEKIVEHNFMQMSLLKLLNTEKELDIIFNLSMYSNVMKNAVVSRKPHIIVYYLIKLAKQFHSYYIHNRIINEDKDLTKARLMFSIAIQRTLKHGLNMLKISAPEEMQ